MGLRTSPGRPLDMIYRNRDCHLCCTIMYLMTHTYRPGSKAIEWHNARPEMAFEITKSGGKIIERQNSRIHHEHLLRVRMDKVGVVVLCCTMHTMHPALDFSTSYTFSQSVQSPTSTWD